MGTLFLVATPIGNLGDMTPRAIETLRAVRLIAAEDTRHTGKLLRHFGVATPSLSYHAFNERARRERLLAELAEGDVALVSDAGSPGISDPGHDLVVAAIAAGHRVAPVPGPSSLVAAVTASGLVEGPFIMLGFLPRQATERATVVGRAAATGLPLVVFEAPGRLAATLAQLTRIAGDRQAAVARELTKVHEEIVRDRLTALAARYADAPPRGEIVLVVGPPEGGADDGGDAEIVLRSLLDGGLSPSRAAREAAGITGRARSDLYALALRLKQGGDPGGETPSR